MMMMMTTMMTMIRAMTMTMTMRVRMTMRTRMMVVVVVWWLVGGLLDKGHKCRALSRNLVLQG